MINSIAMTTANYDDLSATCNHSSMSECPFSDPEYDGAKDPLGLNHNKGIIKFNSRIRKFYEMYRMRGYRPCV